MLKIIHFYSLGVNFRWCEIFNELFQNEEKILRSSIASNLSNNEEIAQNNNGVQLKQFVSNEYSLN